VCGQGFQSGMAASVAIQQATSSSSTAFTSCSLVEMSLGGPSSASAVARVCLKSSQSAFLQHRLGEDAATLGRASIVQRISKWSALGGLLLASTLQ
jgi:hypothetical protein